MNKLKTYLQWLGLGKVPSNTNKQQGSCEETIIQEHL